MTFFAYVVVFAMIAWLARRSRRRSRKRAKASTTSKQNLKPPLKRDMAMIDAEITMVTDEIDFFSTYKDHDAEHATDSIVLQTGEHLLATLSVVGLIENNQMEDVAEPELLDEGEFIVTTVRGVFAGEQQAKDLWNCCRQRRHCQYAAEIGLWCGSCAWPQRAAC